MSYWNNLPAGLALVSGGLRASDSRYFYPGTTIHCPTGGPHGTDIQEIVEALSLEADSTYAADHIAELASYDLVQIFTQGGSSGGSFGGWWDCGDFASNPDKSSFFTAVSITGGPSSELRDFSDGSLRPVLNPTQANWTPLQDGLWMRPTPLAWAGQDPDNEANRSMWLPSEAMALLGTMHASYSMAEVSGYDLNFGSGVAAWNVIDGAPYEPTGEVVICFV